MEHRLHGGLIPAHAGKTQDQPRRTPQTSAHPRSRGENGPGDRACLTSSGSSPLTRGKHDEALGDELARGLIPAHAGKTCLSRAVAVRTAAHPRSRGENLIGAVRTLVVTGSSPLTRGKRNAAQSVGEWPLAHPRSRGENVRCDVHKVKGAGSSPLTRGKRCHAGSPQQRRRLIPAHAGKTVAAPLTSQRATAHPRSRGENSDEVLCGFADGGSSPLTRGKPKLPAYSFARAGLIPAHAGKTPRD